MDINHFHYVVEITRCGSINKAAQSLHISQPNLSVSIKNLENELGFNIFHRNSTGITLTKEGLLFFESAQKIVAEMDRINNIPSMFIDRDNISISCTNSFDFMNTFLRFKRDHPSNKFEDSFKETGLIQTTKDVIEQNYRMALFYCFDRIHDKYYDIAKKYNMKLVPITKNQPLILLVSKKNPLALKKEIDFKDIPDYRMVMYENFEFDEWLGILGLENDDKVMYVFDRGGLIDTISQSMYVNVMMKRFTGTYSPDCAEIPIVNAPCGMNAYLMYHSSYKMNRREKLLVRYLKEIFNKHSVIED